MVPPRSRRRARSAPCGTRPHRPGTRPSRHRRRAEFGSPRSPDRTRTTHGQPPICARQLSLSRARSQQAQLRAAAGPCFKAGMKTPWQCDYESKLCSLIRGLYYKPILQIRTIKAGRISGHHYQLMQTRVHKTPANPTHAAATARCPAHSLLTDCGDALPGMFWSGARSIRVGNQAHLPRAAHRLGPIARPQLGEQLSLESVFVFVRFW